MSLFAVFTITCFALVGLASKPTIAQSNNPALETLSRFRNKTFGPVGLLISSSGCPIEEAEATSTLDSELIRHQFFMDSITHVYRERIPPRIVHARGSGAFGYFEVTNDISNICKALFLGKVGKRTPIAVRFSPGITDQGGPETLRDIRGISIKFYTEDGNWDFVGLNIPTFAVRDPLYFTAFVHAARRNPVNNVIDLTSMWDFLTLRPESAIFMLTLLSDQGTSDGYRKIPNFSVHTYQLVNQYGESSFARFQLTPVIGIRNLNATQAAYITGQDQDYASKDLYNAIAEGNYPIWDFGAQILSMKDVMNAKFDVFDVTKILPSDRYPVFNFGRIVLSRNPVNSFAEVEQLAFCPGNLVPGILGAPDKMFEGRILSYRDAHLYRLGTNVNQIAINKPINVGFTYNRDGKGPVRDNSWDIPSYFPNSFNGPAPYTDFTRRTKLLKYTFQGPSDDISQAQDYYNKFTDVEKKNLAANLAASLSSVPTFIQERATKWFYFINPNLGDLVLKSLNPSRNQNANYSTFLSPS